MSFITVNGNVVPLGELTPSADARNTNYIFIKGANNIGEEEKRELAGLGVIVDEYLGENVYLCRYEPADLGPVQALGYVDAAAVYARRIKSSAFLKGAIDAGQLPQQAGQRTATAAVAAPGTFSVEVLLHKGAGDVEGVLDGIAQATGVDRASISVEHNKIRLSADAAGIEGIERLDAVRAIEGRVPKKLYNNLARGDLDIDTIQPGANDPPIVLESIQYTGAGQVVAVADTGFDMGSTTDVHPAFTGRVKALLPIGRKKSGKTNDTDGHGTHVAGSVLGDGSSETMGGKIRGTAPGAVLVLQAMLTADGGLATPANHWDLFEPPYKDHGARIATNSWGPDWQGAGSRQVRYDSDARALDGFVYHNQDHIILFAAGNDGMEKPDTEIADYEGPQDAHIGSSGAAKNCITVGATESSRRYNRNTFGYDPNAPPGNPSAIAAFSSRGPTNEFRMKPDVVAPGVAILSAASRGAKGNTKNKSRMSKDDKWMFDTGTSMSTPLVAGCCALLREALAAKGARTTSAALIKALLINGAVDLGRPRAEQGYGRVDVSRSLATIEKGGVNGFADIGFPSPAGKLKVGKSWSVEVALPPHAQSNGNAAGNDIFKATLAYSDRAGHMLQNKLSLRVRFAGGSSADVEKRGSEDNQGLSENNIEQVAYRREGQGHSKAIITVKAERITRLNEPQAFAVVWGVYRGL